MNEELKSRFRNTFVWSVGAIMLSLVFTFLTALVERSNNPPYGELSEVLWWWIGTVSGNGSDSIMPLSNIGKLFAGGVIISSMVFFVLMISEITTLIKVFYERKSMGIIKIKYSGHVVIFGYTSLTAGVIKLLRRHYGEEVKIVMVTNDVDQNPFPDEVDFIFANPIRKSTFEESNVKNSVAAIILANDRFTDPDAYSLVIAAAIAKSNPKVTTMVELINDEMKDVFKSTFIDAFINRKELLKDLLDQTEYPKFIRIINKETDLDINHPNPDPVKVDLV